MSSNYTPQAAVPTSITLPETGDTANGPTFKTPLKQLADWAKWLNTKYAALQWVADNNVPQLAGNLGVLEYAAPIAKVMIVPPTACIAGTSMGNVSFVWDANAGGLRMWNRNTTPAVALASFPIVVPDGSTITRIRGRALLYDASHELYMNLYSTNPGWVYDVLPAVTTATTVFAVHAAGDANKQAMASYDPDIVIDPNRVYSLDMQLNAPAGSSASPASGDAILGLQIFYTTKRVAK